MLVPATTKKIEVICPFCKTRDLIGIPEKKIKNSSHLTTISIQKGLICPHHFQIFIDKNLQIRGYQKVDFELNRDNSKELRNGVKSFNRKEEKKSNLFENIIIDDNSVGKKTSTSSNKIGTNDLNRENVRDGKEVTLKDLYEEFWEFIDEDNETFQKFIINDKKRKKISKDPNRSEYYNHIEINQEI
jgi:hypothetical protein